MPGSAFAVQNNTIMKENAKVIVMNGPQAGRELTQVGVTLVRVGGEEGPGAAGGGRMMEGGERAVQEEVQPCKLWFI